MHVQLNPVGNMKLLSPIEVEKLQQSATSKLYNLYRNCSLAVLNSGSHTDDAEEIYQQFQLIPHPAVFLNCQDWVFP